VIFSKDNELQNQLECPKQEQIGPTHFPSFGKWISTCRRVDVSTRLRDVTFLNPAIYNTPPPRHRSPCNNPFITPLPSSLSPCEHDTMSFRILDTYKAYKVQERKFTGVCKFPEHLIPLIVHFAGLDTPFGCLSAPKTSKKGIETRESRGNCLIQ